MSPRDERGLSFVGRRLGPALRFFGLAVNEIGGPCVLYSRESRMMYAMAPRYPDIHVRLRSRNPFALVSAVRMALRGSHVDPGEIHRFTEEALESDEPQRMRQVCSNWAEIEVTS